MMFPAYLILLVIVAGIGRILWLELQETRGPDSFDSFLPPPSWEVRVQEAADALWAARMVESWEHGYAITVLVAEVFELEEVER